MLLFLLLLLLWLFLLRMNCVHNLFLSFRQKAFRFAMPPMSAFAREGQPLLSSLLFTLAYALGQIIVAGSPMEVEETAADVENDFPRLRQSLEHLPNRTGYTEQIRNSYEKF